MQSHFFRIAVLGGDGIGPEVAASALQVLDAVGEKLTGVTLVYNEFPAGAGEFLKNGNPLPASTLEACRSADATLLGAMGLPDVRWPGGTEMAPQLDLREELDLFAGIRPIHLYNAAHTPLKGYQEGGIDLVIFRENTEGLFATRKNTWLKDAGEVSDRLVVTRRGAERIVRAAFQEARRRRKFVTLVDKANVLPSMAFFRMVFDHVAAEFPDVSAERIYVDAAALYLVQKPERFDVMVMENLFGDILSDLAAGIVGGMGMAPSADIGEKHGVFQPSHGSAPGIAGQGVANPIATILSAAMMLDWLPGAETTRGAHMIRRAVQQVCCSSANRTADLGGALTTRQMTERILEAL
ncbi:MAG: isocitrate/isopropylmalate dehydrogenase family protein [Bryobacterales bacterium]|nr:isocitrate/isopropylmalate dehydrogenase family protein [Bryobacterales bacterium]